MLRLFAISREFKTKQLKTHSNRICLMILCVRMYSVCYYFFLRNSYQWARASSFTRFLDHTQRRTTVGRKSSERVIRSSQRPLPDNTQHSQQTDIHAPGGIRTNNLTRRVTADSRLRPRRPLGPAC